MEDLSARAIRGPGCCTLRSTAKFCLAYITTLLILTLLFTAANSEPMDSEQEFWWWIFLISLIVVTALSTTSLATMIYTDYNRSPLNQDIEQDMRLRRNENSANSTSYRTVLTVNSIPGIQRIDPTNPNIMTLPESPSVEEMAIKQDLAKKDQFVNLTPKSPVTVVDMSARRKASDSTKAISKDDKKRKKKKR